MTSSSSSSPEIPAATSANRQQQQQQQFSYKHATHDEVLEDLSSRFILNLPNEELVLERICFQVEQAHWFYEDFIREENPKFPSLPLKKFSAMLFHACPLLQQWSHDHEQAFNNFMQYKTRVPVCGAIMLNDTWEKCILVKGWKSSSGWGFPKGKINEDEPEPNCAIREVLEETGYNLAGQLNPQDVIEMSIKEQKISLYIVPGVPEDYPFQTKTRKEISKIEWFKLTDLPTWKRSKAAPGKFYLISPFIGALKAFINERKPRASNKKPQKRGKNAQVVSPPSAALDRADNDNLQESSSQSSSAENGDPHTPSPHYGESVAVAEYVANVEDTPISQPSLLSQNLDPHFARLLSSLTMSAEAANANKDCEKQVFPEASHLVSTPDDNSGASMETSSNERGGDDDDWSTSVPSRLSDRSRPPQLHGSTSNVSAPFSYQANKPGSHAHQPFTPSFSGRRGEEQQSSLDLSSSTFKTSPTLPVKSPRTNSRRTSSTADISPYLSRPTEVPTSAKTLRQLALLEAVADESARMTPYLVHRDAGLVPHPMSTSTHLPPFAPPAPFDHGLIYSSQAPSIDRVSTALPFAAQSDPFQVRARTSHGHRGPFQPASNSLSMSHAQLSALMHVQNTAPVVGRYPPFVSSPTMTPYSTFPHPRGVVPPQQHYYQGGMAPYNLLPAHPMQHTAPFPTPNNARLGPTPKPSLPSSSNSLLSILNGNRSAAPA